MNGEASVEDAVDRRILELHRLIAKEDEAIVPDARSRAALQRFLEELSATGGFVEPVVFINDDGTYRAIWTTTQGSQRVEQFAVRFLTSGRVQVVYSDPAPKMRKDRRSLAGGGLVARDIPRSRLMDLMRTSSLEGFVRKGTLPVRE